MDTADFTAAIIGRRFGIGALALAALLSACAHAPTLTASRDSLTPEEHLRLGTVYESQGLRAEAAAQYEAAARGAPACVECWISLGNIAFPDGRLKEAETCFRKALKAAPHNPGAANNLAMVIMTRKGGLAEAEALARDALAHAGALRPYVLDTLANILLRERRYAEALSALDEAETETPAANQRVRDQLLATRNSIKTAASEENHPQNTR